MTTDDFEGFFDNDGKAPPLPEHQQVFDELLDTYNEGLEPLENWRTVDLTRLGNAIDAELQRRAHEAGASG